MSHYWHLACLDCDDHRGGFGNDQSQWDVEMHRLAQSAEALATVATILQNINQRGRNLELKVSQWDNTLLLEWFLQHRGHRIVAEDEYGIVFGECGKNQRCACCAHSFFCRLPTGHGGECSPKRSDGG
jgi:hypothetical protein